MPASASASQLRFITRTMFARSPGVMLRNRSSAIAASTGCVSSRSPTPALIPSSIRRPACLASHEVNRHWAACICGQRITLFAPRLGLTGPSPRRPAYISLGSIRQLADPEDGQAMHLGRRSRALRTNLSEHVAITVSRNLSSGSCPSAARAAERCGVNRLNLTIAGSGESVPNKRKAR